MQITNKKSDLQRNYDRSFIAEVRMKKVCKIIAILLVLAIVGCSVNVHEAEKADALEETVSSEKLVVYMNTAPSCI